jgi:single-strand DNA-binding protein
MLNVAVLMGRLVADPELRHTSSGISVTSFTIAVDRSYVKSGTERQTDFIDIVAWRGTAEFVCKYFRKGQLAAVQGSIQTRTYTDRNENKRKAFEIVADNVHFAEPKRSSGSSSGNYSGAGNSPADSHSEQPAPAYANGDTGDFEEIPSDDDLPF